MMELASLFAIAIACLSCGLMIGLLLSSSSWHDKITKSAINGEPFNVGDCRFKVIPANKIALAKCSPDEDV